MYQNKQETSSSYPGKNRNILQWTFMGTLPHVTNHGLSRPYTHCTIPSPHQGTCSHSLADPVKTLPVPPTFHFVHCTSEKTRFVQKLKNCTYTRWTTQNQHVCLERKRKTNFMYIIYHLDFILWYFGFDILWYFILTFYVIIHYTYALSRLRPSSFPFNPKYSSITQDLIHGARPVGAEKSSGYAILKLLIFPGTYFG